MVEDNFFKHPYFNSIFKYEYYVDKFALLCCEAQKKIAYSYPKVTTLIFSRHQVEMQSEHAMQEILSVESRLHKCRPNYKKTM